jgi:hypothetical protein
MDAMGGLLLLVLALALYFLPSIVGQKKKNAGAIFALNLLLGWTLIGWVVAFVWAVTVETGVPATSPATQFGGASKYNCPACQSLVVLDAAGCWKCGVAFKKAIKKCPDCAEDVKSDARKCRFCGYQFESASSATMRSPPK